MRLFSDNKAAISIAQIQFIMIGRNMLEINRHFIKEKIDSGIILLEYVPSGNPVADILTKGLYYRDFEKLKGKLGLFDVYAPA